MTNTKWKAAGTILALVVAFGGGIYFGVTEKLHSSASAYTTNVIGSVTQPTDVDMSQFWAAYQLLNDHFVVTHASSTFPDKQKQVYGAIAGLAASFGDPYTVFFPPSDAKIFTEDISGSFGGVGMQVDNDAKGNLVVVAPLKDSPAQKAGIHSGDIILMIGTTSSQFLPTDQAVKIIRGPIGTSVTFTLHREGEPKPLSISVVRDTIKIPVIDTQKRDDGVFVISLYSFSENSADLFRTALREFVQSGDHKLLLDLRGNPGGYLDAAVNMASYFLPVGATIVTEDFKGKHDNTTHRSFGYNIFANDPQFKMAILIDQGSASASEILSGALQQNNVAKLVGTRSFGKGSVQELMDVGGGAELKITIARWLTPNGSSISDGGLHADIVSTTTQELVAAKKDVQKDAAVSYLLGK
jgi:carboxyl-terminal processing protease